MTGPSAAPRFQIEPVSLDGEHVRLLPLSQDHAADLRDAARDGEGWRLWYTSVPTPEGMTAEIERRLELRNKHGMLPFTVVRPSDNRIVGMTSFMNIDRAVPRVEIGSTWYAASVRRTALNTEAKWLLLSHAFETWSVVAVEFRTHFLNHASRRAIERLGAKLDGVLRAHQRMLDGSLRDSCVYSIVAAEWPAVRTHLRWQLDAPRER
ncbi:GNAT family N-acetyltransferase [Rhizosaccharibacter radicis]|uniref:GNAT family N-acetyltransferase n=1 Tax=Rhizosaccharibacter radicis TaxID=2782605 RepID=A0ABT1W229_9PROT|nr:GNAT family N-acetyltransferase [Acetobacteraceae bacterium KSS12]